MLRMVVIDDENVERQGIIQFIDWAQYDIEIVGEAWNGVEGIELIRNTRPDIVLTDVKMPVMNGIEMIQKAITFHEDCIYAVLSGYGDYEYTSQAMRLGVKYYILKPCDEDSLLKVLLQAKAEREKKVQELEIEHQNSLEVKKLLPKAKIQFLKDVLTHSYIRKEEMEFYENACNPSGDQIRVLIFQRKTEDSYLSAFVIDNILEELIGSEHVLMQTELEHQVVFIIRCNNLTKLQYIVEQIIEHFQKIFGDKLQSMTSDEGFFSNIYQLYSQADSRLNRSNLKIERVREKIKYSDFTGFETMEDLLMQYAMLIRIFLYEQMELTEMKEVCSQLFIKIYQSKDFDDALKESDSTSRLYESVISYAMQEEGMQLTDSERKMKKILIPVFTYALERQFSMQWLAKEILFMNVDYLSRLFKSNMHIKLPDYICMIRMKLAGRLLLEYPDCNISNLAELVGYREDGQYFSKVFKKYYGQSISAYRS